MSERRKRLVPLERDGKIAHQPPPEDAFVSYSGPWGPGTTEVPSATFKGGPPSELADRLERIRAQIVSLGPSATKQLVAQTLGRVDDWGEMQSDYKRDVRAGGGWDRLKLEALNE